MSKHISRRLGSTVLVATVAVGVGGVVAAHAVGTSIHTASATESFLISYGPGEHEVVVAHGDITGGGKDSAANGYDVLHLGGGTLRINHPDSKSKYHQKLNPTTCFASFTITGPYTLGGGTGKYAGYTGRGTYTVTGEAVARRTSGGACNLKANPSVEAAYIRASGTVHR
jgi:hypothetical protein